MSARDELPPQSFIDDCSKHCRCCDCSNPPCAGVMAGGMCDELCHCERSDDTRPEDQCAPYYDDEDDEDDIRECGGCHEPKAHCLCPEPS